MNNPNLQLREEKKYEKDTSLLIFDTKNLLLETNNQGLLLSRIKVISGIYTFESPISETEYDRLITRVWHIYARADDKGELGSVRGVIRPSINEDTVSVNESITPQFHFLLKMDNQRYMGRSIKYIEDELFTAIMHHDEVQYQEFKKKHMKYDVSFVPAELQIPRTPNYIDAIFRRI